MPQLSLQPLARTDREGRACSHNRQVWARSHAAGGVLWFECGLCTHRAGLPARRAPPCGRLPSDMHTRESRTTQAPGWPPCVRQCLHCRVGV